MYSTLFAICNTIQSYAKLTEGCAKFKWSVYLSIAGFLLEPETLILNMPNSIFQTQTVLAYCWAFWNRNLNWCGHSAVENAYAAFCNYGFSSYTVLPIRLTRERDREVQVVHKTGIRVWFGITQRILANYIISTYDTYWRPLIIYFAYPCLKRKAYTTDAVIKMALFFTYAFVILIHLEIGQAFKSYNPVCLKKPKPIESTSSCCPVLPHIIFELHDWF